MTYVGGKMLRTHQLVLFLLLLGTAGSAGAQDRRQPRRMPGALDQLRPTPRDSGWVVRASPTVDLWFHGMALAGLGDPDSPLPYYNPDYVTLVKRAKADRRLVTPLDSAAEELNRDFRGIDRPEIFQFLPLYFRGVPPQRMLDALSTVADGRAVDNPTIAGDARLGISLAAVALQGKSERRFLKRFVTALGAEWDQFYHAYWDQQHQADSARYEHIAEVWRTQLTPALEPFLSRAHLEGGTSYPSPPLGLEGRLEPGDPLDGYDNLVAVWLPPGQEGADRSTFAVLKELCFAIVDDVVQQSRDEGDRKAVEALRSRAAVRCGDLLLEFYAPALVARYRRLFLRAGGQADTTAAMASAFENVYALPPKVYAALRHEVRRR